MSFRKLDIFKKLPKDLTEPTFCGALVSILCTVVLVSLCVSEIHRYFQVEQKSDLLFDISHSNDHIRVNIDIAFPAIPCDVLGLQIQDVVGQHIQDFGGDVYTQATSEQGHILNQQSIRIRHQKNVDQLLGDIKKELDEKQGCKIAGQFNINRTPGEFQITSTTYQDVVQKLMQEGRDFDFSYTINKLSFESIQSSVVTEQFSPLENFSQNSTVLMGGKHYHLHTNFWLTLIPSNQKGIRHSQFYMYTFQEQTLKTAAYSGLKFNYVVSPISIEYYNKKEDIMEFMVHICAIVGGIFTIAGIVDAFLHKSFGLLFKERIGKLQ